MQAQILDLIRDLQDEFNSAVIIITHDLGVVAELADDILVMYAGRSVEYSSADAVFDSPQHPYTWGLLASMPRLDREPTERLAPIAGSPPSLIQVPSGCPFHPRCTVRDLVGRACTSQRPPFRSVAPDHYIACHLDAASRASSWTDDHDGARVMTTTDLSAPAEAPAASAGEPLLVVTDLTKHFPIRKGLLQRQVGSVQAVDGVTFEVSKGETIALVGESGCGKTTTGRMITRLLEPTAGSVVFEGQDISNVGARTMRPLRRDVQMIFQDPYSSLNPRHTVGRSSAHRTGFRGPRPTRTKRAVQDLLELVGLSPEHYNRYPHEFSGGQRQRIGIARSLALKPKLIVADEPVSALDVSIQAQVINLLEDLQDELGLTYVVIAHDLSVVRHMSDRVAVMYLGTMVEMADRTSLYTSPRHPYTRALLSAVPIPDTRRRLHRDRIRLQGDVPSPIDPPTGCRFHTRCWKATELCSSVAPPLIDLAPGHRVACHHPEEPAPSTGDG